jgi:secreted PhoX family phosphatase
MRAAGALLLLATSWAVRGQYSVPNVSNIPGAVTNVLGRTTIINQGLVGVGHISASAIDSFGETFGSMSGMQITGWKNNGDGTYSGTLNVLPDRGYNSGGFYSDYAARINQIGFTFRPYTSASNIGGTSDAEKLAAQNQFTFTTGINGVKFTYSDPVTGLNSVTTGLDPGTNYVTLFGQTVPYVRSFMGLQSPAATNLTTYPNVNKLPVDSEALVLKADGSGYIGDEYGANIYYFNSSKTITGVIVPPPAFQPKLTNSPNFSSTNVPTSGRRNNQGFEGVALSPDGARLFAMLQSATIQDSDANAQNRKHTRLLVYDVSTNPTNSTPLAEYAFTLPTYRTTGDGRAVNATAAQSEILALDNQRLLVLSRDSNGLGSVSTNQNVFKSVLLADLSVGTPTNFATDAAKNASGGKIDPSPGVLDPAIVPVSWTEAVNLLNTTQLGKFNVRFDTGTNQVSKLMMGEKWEGMALVPTGDVGKPNDYFLFVGNDNDFTTSAGTIRGPDGTLVTYNAFNGYPANRIPSPLDSANNESDTRVLVYRVSILMDARASTPLSSYLDFAALATAGPSTTVLPYYTPSGPAYAKGFDVQAVSIATVGDPAGSPFPNGYKMAGIPDGLGAFDNGNGTFTLLMNHELRGGDLPGGFGTSTTNATTGVVTTNANGAQGITRAYGGKGSFVSRWVINKSDLSVVSVRDQMLPNSLNLWSTNGYRKFDPATDFHLSRFCSADLPPVSAFYNSATGRGTTNRIFMNGEEDGGAFRPLGRAFAHVVSGPNDGQSYELPWLGKYNWENAVPSPFPQDLTVVMGLDDSDMTNSQVYVYLGTKGTAGLDIAKAGLTNGLLYGIRVEVGGARVAFENSTNVFGTTNRVRSAAFKLHNFGDVTYMSGNELDSNSNTNITSFQRVEDGAWDPTHPNDFYFVTTGRVESTATRSTFNDVTNPTRLWRLRFTDITHPEQGGTIDMVLDGPIGTGNGLSHDQLVMMDNICFLNDGNILIQEDPGNYGRLSKMWHYSPATGELVELLAADARTFAPGGVAFHTIDEEASGVIDASEILGPGWVLFDVQDHSRSSTELVENGQLVALHLSRMSNTGPATTIPPYYVATRNAFDAGVRPYLLSLITTGDTNVALPNGYKMVGVPDGLGAFDNGNGTFTVLMNHELRGGDLPGGLGTVVAATNATTGVVTFTTNSAQGITRAYGGKGAFISEWIFNKTNFQVTAARDLIATNGVNLYTTNGWRKFNPTNDFHFSRFCSSDLAPVSAFFNALTGKGTTNRIYLTGEEDGGPWRPGQGGRAFATLATGASKGQAYELPWLGKFSWENAVASPFPQDLTVVMGLDDSELANSQVYVYIGMKTLAGADIDRAGLTNGLLYGVRVWDGAKRLGTETNDKALGVAGRVNRARFDLYKFGDVSRKSGDELDRESLAQITNFQRVEDGAWDPMRPNEFYFVTTGRVESNSSRATYHDVTNASRLWRLSFDDITHPEWGGDIELVLDGPTGLKNGLSDAQPVMMDNIAVAHDGRILLQEDPGNYERLSKIWLFDPNDSTLKEVAAATSASFSSTNSPAFLTRDEESSGIIDASEILGPGWYLFDVQVHRVVGGELVEGGQLVAMQIAETSAFPSFRVQPVSQTATIGGTITVAADVVGSGPFTYQWFWNGAAIPGATSREVTLYQLPLNQAGAGLTVAVTGAEGTALSKVATIKVNPIPSLLSLDLVPTITVTGTVGGLYRVEFTDAIGATSGWQTLTNLSLAVSPTTVPDPSGVRKPARIYRVVTP